MAKGRDYFDRPKGGCSLYTYQMIDDGERTVVDVQISLGGATVTGGTAKARERVQACLRKEGMPLLGQDDTATAENIA